MSVVRIQNAHKYYNKGRQNELHVMNDISLELPETGLIAIFGRSGCGKTTLLNTIGGLDRIASGRIELFGQNIRDNTDTVRNRYIGYIFQNYNLNAEETVYENVAAALRLCGMSDEGEIAARVTASLKNVGMDKYISRTPDTLSGGQQQRVAIARALVKNPAIILADEPTGNLDEANTVLVMDILKEISKTHLVLLVTHEAHLVDYYCDRVIELVDGRVESDRENEGANGYIRRNKNDIYLGELEKQETAAPGVTLTYYGEPAAPIGLSVVHIGGKLYLKCDDPTVKILEEGSEIRLREGVFNAQLTPAEGEENANGHRIDMSRLTPVEGKHYGRLYHPKNAIVGAWRENFSGRGGRRRRGRGLRVILILVAIVLAFMSATIGAGLKDFVNTFTSHNENLFYVPLDPAMDYSGLDLASGHNGVLHTRIIGSDPLEDMDYLAFDTTAFMTATPSSLTARGYGQSVSYMPALSVAAGTDKIQNANEIIITTAVADDLIESSPVSYINTYRDLIGLLSVNGRQTQRIVGVVDSSEQFYYMEAFEFVHTLLERHYGSNIAALSETQLKDVTIPAGEVIYIHWIFAEGEPEDLSGALYEVGDTIAVMGRTMTVGEVRTLYPSEAESLNFTGEINILLNDEDFLSLAYTVGEENSFYDVWDTFGGRYYTNHLQIRSSDPAATAAHLREVLGDDGYLSPGEMLTSALAVSRNSALLQGAVLLFFLDLMCLCVFFIMRSSFMSRVREVGILRAIGVTRRNLVFRFAVETAMLLLLTTVIGYTCTGIFIASLSDAPLFSSFFYFPPWISVTLLVVILVAGIFFGILPVLLLLRKTPSEILAKYDI